MLLLTRFAAWWATIRANLHVNCDTCCHYIDESSISANRMLRLNIALASASQSMFFVLRFRDDDGIIVRELFRKRLFL